MWANKDCYLAVPLRGSGWGLRAPTPGGSSFEKEEPENGDTLPLVKSLSSPVLFGGRAQSTGQRRELAVLLFIGHCTCALNPAAQKGEGFDVVRYRRGAGSGLAVLRFSCLPNKAFCVCWLYFHSCRFPNKGNAPQRLLPPSGEEAVRRSLTDGRGICRAFGQDSQPALSSPSGRSLFNLPRSHRPPSGVVPRSAEGTRRRPKRAACGRAGPLPQKPRLLLSSFGANAPFLHSEEGADTRLGTIPSLVL